MSTKAANIRERFSLEFVSANPESLGKGLLNIADSSLPDLVLFDADFEITPKVAVVPSDYVDPVDELRSLFGSVNS